MYFGHSRQTPQSISLVNATLKTASLTSLFNGRPQNATVIQWPAGAQTTAVHVDLQMEFATGFVPGFLGLFGFLPALTSVGGFKTVWTGRRSGDTVGTYPYALGGNSATQRTVTRSDGSTVDLIIPASGLTACVGLQMSIFNDQNGVATIPASSLVSLGDVFASLGFVLEIDGDWKFTYPEDPENDSINGQPWPVPYPPGRVFEGRRTRLSFNEAYVDGATPCWQSLRTLAGNGQSSIIVPRYASLANPALDTASLHATGFMGITKFSQVERAAGDYFNVELSAKETPVLGA